MAGIVGGANGEIVLYRPSDTVSIEVRVAEDTVWLNRRQLAQLFDRDVKTIGKHIGNALKEELDNIQVVANFATTATDGKTYKVEHYNLDMILSVGYRVKSRRGIEFRRWANEVLKEYLLRGYSINQRLNDRVSLLEQTVEEHSKKIAFFVRSSLPPVEGIFFDGQVFDAYAFACDLVKRAKHEIVLIDNYIDETVLTLLDKRDAGVAATVYTAKIDPQLRLDINRHNSQYAPIAVNAFNKSHDRFLCIDGEVFHIGASLKDLGKRWFAFSKMEDLTKEEIISRINGQQTAL